MAKCVTQSKMAAKAKWSTTPSCGKTKDPENEDETSWHPRSTPAGHPKTRGTGKRLKYYVLYRTQTICAHNSKPKEINSAVAWLADALRCHRARVFVYVVEAKYTNTSSLFKQRLMSGVCIQISCRSNFGRALIL